MEKVLTENYFSNALYANLLRPISSLSSYTFLHSHRTLVGNIWHHLLTFRQALNSLALFICKMKMK